MRMLDLLNRPWPPEPWSEGGKIPWNEPSFSERMLHEHLTQAHDLASRRSEYIDKAVAWIHEDLLGGRPSRILDLGCGPGLFLQRLGKRGHQCMGIDFGPASVRHAREITQGLPVEVIEGDIRTTPFGEGYDLAMFVFGELSVFPEADARDILQRMRKCASKLVVEVQTAEVLLESDCPGRRWDVNEKGLFSDRPHMLLTETHFDEKAMAVTTRFIVIDLATGETSMVSQSDRVYADDEWVDLLKECRWELEQKLPSLGPEDDRRFITLVAR